MNDASPLAGPAERSGLRNYEGHWQDNGQAREDAPPWARFRSKMAQEFPSPFRSRQDPLAAQIGALVAKLDRLRPAEDGPGYLGGKPGLAFTYPSVKNAEIPREMGDLDDVLSQVVDLFQGAPNWGSPLTLCNVNPQANTAALLRQRRGFGPGHAVPALSPGDRRKGAVRKGIERPCRPG